MCFELPPISRVQEMKGSSLRVGVFLQELFYDGANSVSDHQIGATIVRRRLVVDNGHFVALGYLYVVIDKKLGEKIKKAEN